MKKCWLILFLFLAVAHQLKSQDVILTGETSKGDSLLFGADSLKKVAILKSLNRKINGYGDSINSLQHKTPQNLKSINEKLDTQSYMKRLESQRLKLTSKIDSLRNLRQAHTRLTQQLTKINTELDSINPLSTLSGIENTQNRIPSVQNEVNQEISKVEGKVNEKAVLFSKNGGNVSELNLPPTNINLTANLPIDVGIPDASLPSIENPLSKIENPLSEVKAPDITLHSKHNDVSNIPKLPDVKIDNLNIQELEKVGELKGDVSDVSKVSGQVKGYQDDINNLKEGNLSKLEELPDGIEKKVENLDELDGFKDQIKNFEEVKKTWNDPEVMREEALNKAKETAVNHFAGHEEELKAVMEKMSKLKSKIPDPEGAIDLFKKRQQSLKGKPVVERLIPGLTLQFQKNNSFWLDFNPQVGFKISSRFVAGLGWNERVCYDFKLWQWDKEYRIYGARTFLQFKLKDNFWLRTEAEEMNAPKRATWHMSSEIVGRHWVFSWFGGMKKDFQFSKAFKGNVQTLYNISNPGKRSPYTSRLNVRIGFEIPIKEKQKSPQ